MKKVMAINNIMMTVKMNRNHKKCLDEQTQQMVADFQRSKSSPPYYAILFFLPISFDRGRKMYTPLYSYMIYIVIELTSRTLLIYFN